MTCALRVKQNDFDFQVTRGAEASPMASSVTSTARQLFADLDVIKCAWHSMRCSNTLPDPCLGRPHADLNVIAQPGDAVHPFGGYLLCKATAAHGFPDLYDQARFDLELVGIRQAT
jgi:hypothetical protein